VSSLANGLTLKLRNPEKDDSRKDAKQAKFSERKNLFLCLLGVLARKSLIEILLMAIP
jgi:hypothetical protein